VPKRVAVVGGGITGLSAALAHARSGHEVHLFEKDASLGGKIGELTLDGRRFPNGPDAFLARRPEVIDFARSLGLDEALTTPAAGSARIYRDGNLHPLPPNVLGVPATAELGATGLISAAGVTRAAADLTAADDRPAGDESVGDLVRRRLGDEVLEYLVDPLLGGINAGDSDRLSLIAGVPQLATLRGVLPSLLESAAATIADAPSRTGPVFHGIEGGLSRLVDRAQAELVAMDVELHLGTAAVLDRSKTGWSVNGVATDNVVITTPAFATAELIDDVAPDAAELLRSIDYSSVGLTVLILPPNTIEIDPSISGVLVPRLCGLHVTAVSFASHKWPALAPDGSQVLRVSVGRRTDTRWSQLRDGEVIQVIRNDLSEIFGTIIPDGPAVLTRWNNSLPQYDVDHLDRVAAITRATESLTGLTITGAWANGLGLPACVAAGETSVSGSS